MPRNVAAPLGRGANFEDVMDSSQVLLFLGYSIVGLFALVTLLSGFFQVMTA
jgi:hypothetical protein